MRHSLKFGIVGSIVLVSATVATAQSSRLGDAVLNDIVYYSDASKTVEVGRNQGVCYGGNGSPVWAGQSQFTAGETTPYFVIQRVGRCLPDGSTQYE